MMVLELYAHARSVSNPFFRSSVDYFRSNFFGRSQFADLHLGQTLGFSSLSRGKDANL